MRGSPETHCCGLWRSLRRRKSSAKSSSGCPQPSRITNKRRWHADSSSRLCHYEIVTYPLVIQGGMGVGVSGWKLAREVSRTGQLGVVSGTALDQVVARRLQDGDPGGHIRRALDHFPFPKTAERVWQTYYIPGGKEETQAYIKTPLHDKSGPREVTELCILGNFVEIYLAREGHSNPVGINYLEKIQLPHLADLRGD